MHGAKSAMGLAALACCALVLLVVSSSQGSRALERVQVVYLPQSALRQQSYLGQQQRALPQMQMAQMEFLPLQMLVCDPDSPHCGYGGVDTSEEAYANASPLAIINEQCTKEHSWDCPFPGPKNYGPDSPAIWLPEEDLLDDPTLVRKVWPDYPAPSEKKPLLVSAQVLRILEGI